MSVCNCEVLELDPASELLIDSIWRPLQGASLWGGWFPGLNPWAESIHLASQSSSSSFSLGWRRFAGMEED